MTDSTADPASHSGAAAGARSATGEDELQGAGTQDEHQQDREDDGRDRAHPDSLAEKHPNDHAEGASAPHVVGADDALHHRATATVDAWLAHLAESEPAVLAVEADGNRRFVRLQGDEKSVFTVWLLIGQHTLHHETFVMPAPIENHAEFYAHLLQRNHTLRGVAFTIGAEDAIFLEGRTRLEDLDAAMLDEVIGTHFEAVERCFRSAMRIGWRSMFRG